MLAHNSLEVARAIYKQQIVSFLRILPQSIYKVRFDLNKRI